MNDRQEPTPLAPLYVPKFWYSRITPRLRGMYFPDPNGKPAVVLGVVDCFNELIDLVAWHPEKPSKWWLRRGVGVILGESEIERAIFNDVPLRLFPTPHDWLFNHGPGGYWPSACVLDWFAPADVHMALSGARIETTADIARRLRELRTGPRLDIGMIPAPQEVA